MEVQLIARNDADQLWTGAASKLITFACGNLKGRSRRCWQWFPHDISVVGPTVPRPTATGVSIMTDAYALQPEPARRTAEQQAAEQQAAEQQAAEQQAAEQWGTEQQALDLSMARKLVESSNIATAVLEADAAHSRLSVYDLPFFQEQAQLEREQFLTGMLAAAGRGLLDSFVDLLNADDLWDRLARNDQALGQKLASAPHPFLLRMELAELLTHHIPELLLSLGYQPPPPSEEWTDLVQKSVQRLFTGGQGDGTSARSSERARQELIFFTRRLRTLVEAAEQKRGADEKDDDPQSSEFLHSLRTIVTAARNRAVPAALAAGASAAVAGAAGGPAGIGIAFLSGGAASLFASATEAAATAWLAEPGHGDAPVMSTSLVITTDLGALDGCIDLMRSATYANIESIRFIVRRGVFQTLQDAADCTVPVRDFLWEWSKVLLSLLDTEPFAFAEAHQTVDLARQAVAGASGH